jgi:ATP-dependent Clp protease ATP-binding subunit ClpB
VVLLDEIEKAHPDVFNILLQVLDDGRLTDNKGRTVNFKNTIIIMTSNIGSHIIQENMDKINDRNQEEILRKTQNDVMLLMRQTIRPEFLNRVDEIIMFTPLNYKQIREVILLQLNKILKQLEANDIKLDITDYALDWIAKQGFDPQYGARPVKRVIQKYILNELSKRILAGNVKKNEAIKVDAFDEDLVFSN